MSQQIIAGRINYPESDADPVRIMRCDPILDVRLVDGNVNISNLDLEGAKLEISGSVTVDQITSTVTVSGDVRVVNPVEISGTVDVSGAFNITEPVEISGTVDVSGDVRVVNPVEISGDVNVVVTNPVEISGTVDVSGDVRVVNPVEISGDVNVVVTNPVEISGGLTISDTVITTVPETDKDAFGRLRISSPYTLFEFTSIYPFDLSNDLKFDISLTGTASLSNEDSVHILNVNTTGDKAIIQSREYVLYQPGKSRLTYLTGVLKPSAGFQGTSYIGSFDASAGYAFGYDTNGIFITERTAGVDTKVYQSSWNGDQLDDISFEKAQIFTMDQEWLGVGQVRLGCIDAGKYRICHKFTHKNELDSPYFAMAKLPVRYEVESDGSAGSLRMICGTVLSEGGFNSLGKKFGTDSFATRTTTGTTTIPIFSIRLKNTYPYINTSIKIQQIDLINLANTKLGYWTIIYNPTSLTGTFIDSPDPNSSSQICYHTTGNTISGGSVITSGFLPADGSIELAMDPDEIIRSQSIGRSIDGQSDVMTLAIRRIGSTNITVYGTLNWLEIR